MNQYGYVSGIASLGPRGFALLTSDRERPIVIVNRQGLDSRSGDSTWALLSAVEPLARQVIVAGDRESSGRWAAALSLGDAILFGDTTGRAFLKARTVDSVPLPDVVRTVERISTNENHVTSKLSRSREAVLSIALSPSELLVLPGETAGALAARVIDRYSSADGHYLGSYRLPGPAIAVAYWHNAVFVLTSAGISSFPVGTSVTTRNVAEGQ